MRIVVFEFRCLIVTGMTVKGRTSPGGHGSNLIVHALVCVICMSTGMGGGEDREIEVEEEE